MTGAQTYGLTDDLRWVPVRAGATGGFSIVSEENASSSGVAPWSYASRSGGITNTSDVTMWTASGVGKRNYITSLQAQNVSATATEVVVKSGSTVLWRANLQASMTAPKSYRFQRPLRGGTNEALTVACVTSGTQTYINAQGYQDQASAAPVVPTTLAELLLGSEPDGVAIDFTDLSVAVRDTTTPANNFVGDVNSWLTYTSPSTKWILGANGLYSSGTTIRTEYNASAAALGVRLDPAATNLALRSQEFDNASWDKARATVTANAAVAPDGTTTADKLVENGVNSTHVVYLVPTLTAAVHTASVFAKAAERTQLHILFQAGGSYNTSVFDLSTGAVTSSGAGHTARIEPAANGWYRCSVTVTNTAAAQEVDFGPAVAGSSSYAGDGVSGIYLWGAQLELGPAMTSYIPTTTATVTRANDDISKAVSAIPFSAPSYSISIRARSASLSLGALFATRAASYGAGNGSLLRLTSASQITAGGNGVATSALFPSSISVGQKFGAAARFSTAGATYAIQGNGGTRADGASLDYTGSGTTHIQLGALSAGSQAFSGHIESILMVPRVYSDAEMTTGSTP